MSVDTNVSESARATVLLLGRTEIVVEDAERHLDMSDVRLLGGTGLTDVRRAFSTEPRVDHVIMGAGLDLQTRLEIVREVFERSDVTTVHLKDRATGPEGFLPFVRAVLRGLRDFPEERDATAGG
ncbi:hypothetical protein [Cellulomonas alba]|uniref:Uncharacterized protein n=1 Tax=Cellulomonas alba TaxID=3053467 RepID=A0ABT7SEF3_9CELL|nr:hypothetical protein [Cellulomonas alba]MDM7854550.1 hypothetical protein [Cellulomonas alba]